MLNTKRILVIPLLAFIMFTLAEAAQEAKLRPLEDFNKLAKQEQLNIMLAGMHEHEGSLANMEMHLHERENTSEGVLIDTSIVIKMLDHAYLLDYDRTWRTANIRRKVRVGWDGQIAKVVDTLIPNGRTTMVISNKQPGDLGGEIPYCGQLGIRTVPPQSGTVASYIDDLSRAKGPGWMIDYEANLFSSGEGRLINLSLGLPHTSRWEYTVDPDRQFIIIHSRHVVPDAQLGLYNHWEMSTDEVRVVQGVAIPWQVTWQLRVDAKIVETKVYTVDSLKLGAESNEDLEFAAGPNTTVMDEIHGEAYSIDKDGNRRFRDFVDASTGKLVKAPTTQPGSISHGATMPAGRP